MAKMIRDLILARDFEWRLPHSPIVHGFETLSSFPIKVPETAYITGRHATLVSVNPAQDPLGNDLVAPQGEQLYEIARALVNIASEIALGRFQGKTQLFEFATLADYTFRYQVDRRHMAARIFFGVIADPNATTKTAKTSDPATYLPVFFGQAFDEDGQHVNQIQPPRNVGGGEYDLFVPLELKFAIARGLVIVRNNQLYAVTDNTYVVLPGIAHGLGLRLLWRNYGEPGRAVFRDMIFTRKDVMDMVKAFSANCGTRRSDEDVLNTYLVAAAMGTPQRMGLNKAGVIDPVTGMPTGQNIMLAAHHSPWIDAPAAGIDPTIDPIRAAHGRAPDFGLGGPGFPKLQDENRIEYVGVDPRYPADYARRFKPSPTSDFSDPIEITLLVAANPDDANGDVDTQPNLILRLRRAGRLVADYLFLKRFSVQVGWQRGSKDDVEKLFDSTGSAALFDFDPAMRDVRRNALLDQIDMIIEKEIAIVSKRGDLDVKAAKAFLGNPYFYFKHRRKTMMWFRLVGADWQMRTGDQAQYDAEALVNRCNAPTPGYSPIAGKGIPTLLMKAALEEVFVSCVRLLPNRDRDPKPWKEMAETNPFISTLGPDAIYSLCQMFSEIAARCKEYDAKSRFLEVMIAKGAKPKKMPPSTADPEVNSEWDRIEKGTPAATVYGDRWQTMLTRARSDTGGAAYFVVQLEGIWRDTKDMVFGRPGSIWEAILGEIRNPVHRGVWDELADVYEWRVRALVTNEEVIYA